MEIIEMVWKVPAGERIVGIVQWRDVVIVTTDRAVGRPIAAQCRVALSTG